MARPSNRPAPPPDSWAAALKNWRKREGLTQAAAAEMIGLTLQGYQRWEQGDARFCLASPAMVSEILKIKK